MEIYVMKQGQRMGPFLPFKLRELLDDKEIEPSDPAWIEGMETWSPLASIEALESWMPRDPALPPPLPVPEAGSTRPTDSLTDLAQLQEIQARRVRAWLRWLARTLDEMLWFSLLWLIAVSAGWLQLWDYLLRSPLLLIGAALLWIPVESFLLSRFTTTAGKWLLGIRVTDDLGQPLSYVAALKRSALVVCTGAGFGLPAQTLLPVLQGTMSWMLYRRTGTTLWDRAANSQLVHTRPTPTGFISIGVILVAWISLFFWIALTIPLPPDGPAELRQKIEEIHLQLQRARMENPAG